MSSRTKRTYNLSPATIGHVRELAEHYDLARSQHGIVELAMGRLYLEVRAREEAATWETAGQDPEFKAVMRVIARDFRDPETWPA